VNKNAPPSFQLNLGAVRHDALTQGFQRITTQRGVRFRGEAGLAAIKNDEIEAEARALLRERIERTPWFKVRMTREQRQAAIEQEVDRNWHLMVLEAAERLAGRGSQEPQ
jgi:tRNA(Ser,Leu) C12 N-acetylase TAN1